MYIYNYICIYIYIIICIYTHNNNFRMISLIVWWLTSHLWWFHSPFGMSLFKPSPCLGAKLTVIWDHMASRGHNAVYWAQKDNIHDISIWSPNDVPFQELDQLLGDQIWWNHHISQFPPDFPLTQPIVPSFRAAFESRGVNSGGRQLSACLVLLRGASIFPLGMRIPDDCYVLHGLSTLPTIVTRSWASWGRAVVGFGDFEFCPSQC